VRTVVWGTDINLREVQRQFTAFVRDFRATTGTDDDGAPILAPEPKYFRYLQDVRCPACLATRLERASGRSSARNGARAATCTVRGCMTPLAGVDAALGRAETASA